MSHIKNRVLFICSHNAARSQMAEAFLNQLAGELFEAESAGIEKGELNQDVIQVMSEVGIDITSHQTKDVFELFTQGKFYQAVITVCDKAKNEPCPLFPGIVKRIAWSFEDPSEFTGTDEEKLEKTREVRDEIKEKIMEFINETKEINYWMPEESLT